MGVRTWRTCQFGLMTNCQRTFQDHSEPQVVETVVNHHCTQGWQSKALHVIIWWRECPQSPVKCHFASRIWWCSLCNPKCLGGERHCLRRSPCSKYVAALLQQEIQSEWKAGAVICAECGPVEISQRNYKPPPPSIKGLHKTPFLQIRDQKH